MYAERAAPYLSFHASAPSVGAARPSLPLQLRELAALLSTGSVEDRGMLRASVQDAQRTMLRSGADHGLLALLLRNMLMDLARAPARFDATYFAQQLGRVVEGVAG